MSLSAGHSLCSDPDSSAEAAPEEVEAQDLESSDEADKMSKVRRFNFHLTGRAAGVGHISGKTPGRCLWMILNRTRHGFDWGTRCLFRETCSLFPGWVHILSAL